MTEEDNSTWKERYDALGMNASMGEADTLLEELTTQEMEAFIKAHEEVKSMTGLNMRQVYMLSSVKVMLEFRNRE